jgi:hypothetical protein
MDEIAELKRIWESVESRLSALNGDQEREYEIINNHIDRMIIGKISIPSTYDEDEIIDAIREAFPAHFDQGKDLVLSGDGMDGTITIDEFNEDGPNVRIAEMTTYDDIEDFDEFMENILDISRTQYLSSGKWITKEYTLVTGTGGPHTEFTTGYQINVYWGGQIPRIHNL